MAAVGGIPKLLAWLASIGALLLASAPGGIFGGQYDAEVAVLTGTLIAVVWYAYFTFRVARSTPALGLESGLAVSQEHVQVRPKVHNPTDRRLDVSITMGIWIDGERFQLGGFYQGSRRVPIDPRREFRCATISLDEELAFTEEDSRGDRFIENESCLVAIRVSWIDNLCESGETTTLHQHTDFRTQIDAVKDPHRIEEFFGHLDGYEQLFGPMERF